MQPMSNLEFFEIIWKDIAPLNYIIGTIVTLFVINKLEGLYVKKRQRFLDGIQGSRLEGVQYVHPNKRQHSHHWRRR